MTSYNVVLVKEIQRETMSAPSPRYNAGKYTSIYLRELCPATESSYSLNWKRLG